MAVAEKVAAETGLPPAGTRAAARRGATGRAATYRVILMAYDRRTGPLPVKDPHDAARCP
ncbi:hypothetical protein [Streptomyces sp. NPDC058247]|uniref:hypothetical protein n=1 Tax=Streptomyces sp. NPDC058247 TaxID=3346401 RepID=UPI0036E8A821